MNPFFISFIRIWVVDSYKAESLLNSDIRLPDNKKLIFTGFLLARRYILLLENLNQRKNICGCNTISKTQPQIKDIHKNKLKETNCY